MADAEDGGPEKASQAPTATGQGGGAPPGQQGNPSVYGGMTRGPMNPSMAPTSAPPKRGGGGIVNKPKFPPIGIEDVKNKQILKQVLGEFLGTAFLVFFGIGSVVTASGTQYHEARIAYKGYEQCRFFEMVQRGQIPNFNSPPDIDKIVDAKCKRDVDCAATDCSAIFSNYSTLGRIVHANSPSGGTIEIPFPPFGLELHVAFGFGIAVASVAQAIGHISGAHLNPAVSWGLVAAGECSLIKACIWTVVQVIGAIFGAGLLRLCTWKIIIFRQKDNNELGLDTSGKKLPPGIFDINSMFSKYPYAITDSYLKKIKSIAEDALKATSPQGGKLKEAPEFDPDKHLVGWSLGASTLAPEVGMALGILIELILTMILVFVVCGVCDSLRKDIKGSAPLAIGFAVFLCHVVGIGYTGSSVNPARTIGPLPFVDSKAAPTALSDLVVYLIGPMLGGVIAGFTYNVFFRAPDEDASPPPQQQMTMPPTRPPSQTPSKMA